MTDMLRPVLETLVVIPIRIADKGDGSYYMLSVSVLQE